MKLKFTILIAVLFFSTTLIVAQKIIINKKAYALNANNREVFNANLNDGSTLDIKFIGKEIVGVQVGPFIGNDDNYLEVTYGKGLDKKETIMRYQHPLLKSTNYSIKIKGNLDSIIFELIDKNKTYFIQIFNINASK